MIVLGSNGSIEYPLDLSTALGYANIQAGHTVYLRGGTYSGTFTNTLNGAAGNNITIQSYPGEWAKIDGSLTVNGSYVTWKNLEIFYSGWTGRESAQSGSNPDDIPNPLFNIRSPGVKFINCIIHDIRQPYCGVESTNDPVFYGCLFYNNGWTAPDRGHGHGLYIQGNTPSAATIKDCIVFNNFGWGVHAYSSDGDNVYGISVIGNTCFNAGVLDLAHQNILMGADYETTEGCSAYNNMTYGGDYGMRSYGWGNSWVSFHDNYSPDGELNIEEAVVDNDNYWGPAAGNQVFLRANDYDSNRTNLTIYNQAEANTVTVDISSLGWTGQCTARNVQDYFVDIQTLTITDGNITVNMQAANRTVSTPVGWTAPAKTFPAFGCFVLEAV